MEENQNNYFAAYLVIQTSDPTDNQLKFTKLLAEWVQNHNGVLYVTIQSGKPTEPPPCPPGGCQ